jgi:hypothetical protein
VRPDQQRVAGVRRGADGVVDDVPGHWARQRLDEHDLARQNDEPSELPLSSTLRP